MVTRLLVLLSFFPKTLGRMLSFLFPRKKKLWVISSWEGRSFADNPKYLFLELETKKYNVDYWWITKNKKLYEEMSTFTKRVLLWPSLPAFFKLIRANVMITSHSISDFVPYLAGGAIHFELYHASFPIKKMGFDDKKLFTGKFIKNLKLLMLYPFIFKKADYSIASSKKTKKTLSGILDIPENKIFETGFPRIDGVLKKDNFLPDQKKIDSICDFSQFDHFIYYVPTFRNNPEFSLFSFNFSSARLEEFLEKINGVFVIRLHPFDVHNKEYIKKIASKRVVIENHGLQDPYPLLKQSDLLITDFSSIFSDYLFLNKPIIFALLDLKGYLEKERDVYVDYNKDFPGEKVQDWDSLMNAMEKILVSKKDDFVSARADAKEIVFSHFQPNNSQRVIGAILESELS